MKVYTYSEARQNLATLLDEVAEGGAVRIRRRDGTSFVLKRERRRRSPLNVKGVDVKLSRREIVQIVRTSRRRTR